MDLLRLSLFDLQRSNVRPVQDGESVQISTVFQSVRDLDTHHYDDSLDPVLERFVTLQSPVVSNVRLFARQHGRPM